MREMECYPYVELRQGDRGYEVMFLQARLAQLRYYGKMIDPQFGSGTYAAMRMFEKAHELPVNGIASIEDQQLLFSPKAQFNPGIPAGLGTGATMPPEGGSWPGDEAPSWWHPLPQYPIFTIAPEVLIPDFNLPTSIPIITPTPGFIQPGIEIPGLELTTPIISPMPGIDLDILKTKFPIPFPEVVIPKP